MVDGQETNETGETKETNETGEAVKGETYRNKRTEQ